MAENSAIEWCDHTFNPWIGCTKVGPGCDNCYAADLSKARLGVPWGSGQPRRHTAASTWKQPRAWDRRAAKLGIRYRVFCASLADVFDNEVPAEWRAELFALIRETPNLDWLLVTKRIGNADKMTRAAGGWPDNVWLGATIVNQAEADRDVPKLLGIEGPRFRFLSMEPLLGLANIEPWLAPWKACQGCDDGEGYGNRCASDRIPRNEQCPWKRAVQIATDHPPFSDDGMPASITCDVRTLDWVIVGGESGPDARPMHPDWAQTVRDQCADAGVPFLFKQWGEWAPVCAMSDDLIDGCYHPAPATRPEASRRCKVGQCVLHTDGERFDGKAMYGMGAFLQGKRAMTMMAVGKKRAGRQLDAVQHDGVPGR